MQRLAYALPYGSMGVTDADIESLARRIDGEPLRGQRQKFVANDWQTYTKKKRARPFS